MLFFYLCYSFTAKLVTGATLSGSSPYSVLDQTFQFTCTQTGSITSNFLQFNRNTSSICTISYPGDASQCAQFTAVPGYSCYCGGSGVFYLNISSVSLQDDDRWRCEVTSQNSNNITLPVYYGPYNNVTFNKTSPVTVIEDVTVSLTPRCSAHCKPDCNYTWWRGIQQVSDNRNLSLGSFRRGQEGDYMCRAENTVTGDTADSQVLTVNVHYPPQSAPVISGLSSSPVYEGDFLAVTCRVSGGKPLVTSVTLTCPGGHQSSSTTTEGSDTRLTTLTFSVTRDLRSKPCRCSAVHSTGRYQLTANRTKNNIYYPPSEPSMSVSPPLPWLQGQSAFAVCQSVDTGYPPASYLWYKDDVLVHQSRQLDLVNVTFQDNSKTFSCMSSNKFIEVKGVTLQSNQIILDVHFPPVLMIHPNSPVRIPAGSDLVLNCSALSNPVNSTVSWYLGDKLLSMNGVLRLLSASTRDSGTYTCKATVMSDKFGNLSSVLTTVVNVYDRPKEPKHFYCIVETETGITLHWKDQNLFKENVSFLLEQRSDDSKEYSLVNAVITKSLSSSVYTASVARQKVSTLYYFRIRTLDLGQQSETVITTCFTSAGENGSNFAAGVGTGVGSTVVVVLLVLAIVYLCRRHTLKETGRTDKSHIYQNASFGTESHEEGVAIGVVQQKNEYAELEAREPQQPNTYEKITTYENAANM